MGFRLTNNSKHKALSKDEIIVDLTTGVEVLRQIIAEKSPEPIILPEQAVETGGKSWK